MQNLFEINRETEIRLFQCKVVKVATNSYEMCSFSIHLNFYQASLETDKHAHRSMRSVAWSYMSVLELPLFYLHPIFISHIYISIFNPFYISKITKITKLSARFKINNFYFFLILIHDREILHISSTKFSVTNRWEKNYTAINHWALRVK